MKKYIFISGTNQSGSTLIGAILGHHGDYQGVDAGEIHAILNPKNERQAGMALNPFWKIVKDNADPLTWLDYLFMYVDVIVDSSKLITWYDQQRVIAEDLGAEVKHIHVFRHPADWLKSRLNRGGPECYLNYVNINGEAMARNPDHVVYLRTLREHPYNMTLKLCILLNLSRFNHKQEYWRAPVKGMFGSPKTRNNAEILPPGPVSDLQVTPEAQLVFETMKERMVKWA